MNNATFHSPDLTTFCRLDGLGLEATGQFLAPDRAVIACRVVDADDWCRRCGSQGVPRDTVTRQLGHEPFGWRPSTLLVRLRRYRCAGCGHVWRQEMSKAAEPRAKLSRRGLRWALEGIVCQHLTVARVAEGLSVSLNTANKAVLADGRRVLKPRLRKRLVPSSLLGLSPRYRPIFPTLTPFLKWLPNGIMVGVVAGGC